LDDRVTVHATDDVPKWTARYLPRPDRDFACRRC